MIHALEILLMIAIFFLGCVVGASAVFFVVSDREVKRSAELVKRSGEV